MGLLVHSYNFSCFHQHCLQNPLFRPSLTNPCSAWFATPSMGTDMQRIPLSIPSQKTNRNLLFCTTDEAAAWPNSAVWYSFPYRPVSHTLQENRLVREHSPGLSRVPRVLGQPFTLPTTPVRHSILHIFIGCSVPIPSSYRSFSYSAEAVTRH